MAKKKVATKAEREHLSKVASLGCLVCQMPCQLHHIRPVGLVGVGLRSSNYHVVPLCREHHAGKFSIHNSKKEFEAMYGTEKQMLHRTLKEVENLEKANNFFNYKGEK